MIIPCSNILILESLNKKIDLLLRVGINHDHHHLT